jgi:hypothetical protein
MWQGVGKAEVGLAAVLDGRAGRWAALARA